MKLYGSSGSCSLPAFSKHVCPSCMKEKEYLLDIAGDGFAIASSGKEVWICLACMRVPFRNCFRRILQRPIACCVGRGHALFDFGVPILVLS